MTWGDAKALYALLIVPLLVLAYALDGQRRRRLAERIGHLPMIARMTASFSPARRRWRAVLMVTGVSLLMVALARPQMPGRAKLTESRGLDLVVALDFSKSMLARDVYPTRLDRAKAELARFIDTLHGDRVGLVAFAGETMSYPLTVDYEAAKLFWRDLTPEDMPVGGTDLGRAITAATDLLKRVRAREGKKRPAQLILLITDGEDTEGQGVAAAKVAAKLGIKIYTLGIGTHNQAPVPLYDDDGKQQGYVTDDKGDPIRVGLDDAALKEMAALTGGDYTPLDPHRFGVERVQQAIAGLERTEEEARFEREPNDVGRWFLVPGFLLLLSAACVRERRRLRTEVAVPTVPAAKESNRAERVLAALILIWALPLLTGFDILKRKDPDIEEGNRQLQAGHAADALKAYDRAVEKLPEEPIAHFDRGVALYLLGKYPEAQKEFLRSSEGSDHDLKADAYYNMGNALLKQEKFKDAVGAYKHTLEMRPDDRRAKWNLELALRRLKEQQQKQQQQQQNAQNQQKQDQNQNQQNQQQQQQRKQDQQKQAQNEQQKQDQQKQAQEQQAQNEQQKQDQQKQDQQKQTQEQQAQADKEREKLAQRMKAQPPPREIDKQDAEAVLDALERVEPTVQKDLARRRAIGRRTTKDW